MNIAHKIALWADKLRDVSAMGLLFAQAPYDRERYQRTQTISLEMFSLATGQPFAELEPLRTTVLARPTPTTCVDAAVIDENGRLLLIQRADNGCWAMPGGISEVGESPAEGCVREMLEETGVPCEPVELVGIFDSRYHSLAGPHHVYQMLFLCRPLSTPTIPASHAHEILAMGWFTAVELPENLNPNHVTRIPEAFRVWQGDHIPFFDKENRQV